MALTAKTASNTSTKVPVTSRSNVATELVCLIPEDPGPNVPSQRHASAAAVAKTLRNRGLRVRNAVKRALPRCVYRNDGKSPC